MTDFTLELSPTGHYTSRGPNYDVYLDGEIIVASRKPEFDACRALQKRGHTGSVSFKRLGRDQIDLKVDIEWGAKHTVSELDKGSVRVVPYIERPEGL